jgi:hypothetical protein
MNRLKILLSLLLCFTAERAFADDATLTYLADRQAISDLVVRYAIAHNTTDETMYKDVFTEDGEFGGIKGLANIILSVRTDIERFNKGFQAGKRTYGVMRHLITNHEVTITGDHAKGECQLLNIAFNKKTGKPEILTMSRYLDDYVKQNGRWLIARRGFAADMANDELAKQIQVGPHTPAKYRTATPR